MIVYRIEWADGGGVYSGAGKSALAGIDHDLQGRHPMPMTDTQFAMQFHAKGWASAKGSKQRDLRWAFESLRSLRHWFYNDDGIRRMSEAGAVLCTYDACDESTVIGRTQCAFDHRVAKLVFKEPLINVLEKV